MNILVISFDQVYPLATGASVSQFSMINYLSDFCNISLLLPEKNDITEKDLYELNQLLPKVKIYALKDQIKSTTDNNLKFLKSFFKRKIKKLIPGQKNNVCSISNNSQDDLEKNFREMYSWNPFYLHSQKYIDKISEIIEADDINIVQLEYVDNLNISTFISSKVKTIFVEHECFFYRMKSHIDAAGITSEFSKYIVEFYRQLEGSLLSDIDGIITFNYSEKNALKSLLSNKEAEEKIIVSPFSVPGNEFKDINEEEFAKIDKLIFLGGEHHYPNKDAVEWFLEKTAEEVFNRFGLKLYVVGKWSQDTIDKYKYHPSNVNFLGFVEDLHSITKNSISISPVRIGGGLKTKILVSMAQGIPVICTKFALDGINAKHLETVMLAEDTYSFCWAVEYLLKDNRRTFMLCQQAQRLMREEYSQSHLGRQRYMFYQKILTSKICD